MLDRIPLLSLSIITLIIVFAAVEFGFFLGRHKRQKIGAEPETPMGSMVGAMLGLLAFILAFTFGLATTRFDQRRLLVLDESNAIGTTLLRADFLPDDAAAEMKSLLKKYLESRTLNVTRENLSQKISESESIQGQMWELAARAGNRKPESYTIGLFIQSLNELIDLHSKRVSISIWNRIPQGIWVILYFVSSLAMGAVGYQFGISGTRTVIVNLALVLAFSSILLLIADLDRPFEGILRAEKEPLFDLANKIHTGNINHTTFQGITP